MAPLANIQKVMPVLFNFFLPFSVFNAIIKEMWDVFAKKKATQEYPQPMTVFPNSRLRVKNT